MENDILIVKNVNSQYSSSKLGIISKKSSTQILKDVSFSIKKNEFFGLVGESGCGKTTLGKAILGLIPYTGTIQVNGLSFSRKNKNAYYTNVQAVFQDPLSALDSHHTIGFTMEEPLIIHKTAGKKERDILVDEMLEKVGLDPSYKKRFPSQLSGGQRQRVCIGAALILKPKLLIADEAISSLDVSVGSQILNLFNQLHEQMDFSMLFISHNLDVVNYLCPRIAVMHKGQITKIGLAEQMSDIFPENP